MDRGLAWAVRSHLGASAHVGTHYRAQFDDSGRPFPAVRHRIAQPAKKLTAPSYPSGEVQCVTSATVRDGLMLARPS